MSHSIPIGLELALGVDVSGSVDSTEYELQKQGYVNAFNNLGSFGSFEPFVATYFEWSDVITPQVGWTMISNVSEAMSFATAIDNIARGGGTFTDPDIAIDYGVDLIQNNNYEGTRRIIDISGDGTGSSTSTQLERDFAESLGITVNGLAIGSSSISDWYTNNLITSDGFVISAESFEDFGDAITQKLQQEVIDPNPIPEPTSMALLAAGAIPLGFSRLRKRFKK
ncbi:DUF1194 domain-containing protein [Desulfohalovibrio reitneri]|uniref:DUF1194 domain-containing protein n=1 Tax=Desulfohalovibrio reitneri TaxID=1307759 RepID=UPI0013776213|nr:DUF1194 domain-containing protein [Desulfohalovibrio reitneri]